MSGYFIVSSSVVLEVSLEARHELCSSSEQASKQVNKPVIKVKYC